MFQRTTIINKILGLNKRIKGIQGGTSSGKTFGILPILINKATQTPDLEISVVAESVPHLKRGAMKDFIKIMKLTNRWFPNRFNKTNSKYTFANGSYIEFFSADDDSKLRGARRNILYINECNNVSFKAYSELAVRTYDEVYLDWNPTAQFWFHLELQNDNDVDFIITTYKDNEACPKSAIDEILKAKEKAKTSKYWNNWYRVYGLGLIGSLEGVVFNNWSKIDKIPEQARLLGYGLDFGYTNDPTSVIAVYKYNDKYIFDEVLYKTGLSNRDIYNHLKDLPKMITYCDSAEPKSIDELSRYGLITKGVDKGKDSILNGISTMQELEILVTSRSTNLIKELRSYCWDEDREGNKLNKPIDKFNHAIDAVRYFCMMTLSRRKSSGKRRKTRVS